MKSQVAVANASAAIGEEISSTSSKRGKLSRSS